MSDIAGNVTHFEAMNGLGVGFGRTEIDVLQCAEHNERFGWHMLTGRRIKKRDADLLVAKGFLADGGVVPMVDGDGFAKQSERERQSYVLTDAGREACRRIAAQQKAGLDALSNLNEDAAEVTGE